MKISILPTTKGKGGKNNLVDAEENVTLRIHRGNKNQRSQSDMTFSNSTTNLEGLRGASQASSTHRAPSFERKKRHGSKYKDKVTISISYPSSEHIASPTMSTTSSNQASMISSCSKEPIALRNSNSAAECHETQNLFKRDNSMGGSRGKKPVSKRTSSGMKVQVRKFRMETKAAKTLAIIVGKQTCHTSASF